MKAYEAKLFVEQFKKRNLPVILVSHGRGAEMLTNRALTVARANENNKTIIIELSLLQRHDSWNHIKILFGSGPSGVQWISYVDLDLMPEDSFHMKTLLCHGWVIKVD